MSPDVLASRHDSSACGRRRAEGATPLTRPIYATSTFVFASAAELEAYQQRQVAQVHLLALRQSERAGGRGEARGARGRRSGARDLVGHGGHLDRVVRPAAGRGRGDLQRGDLRRHAARDRRCSCAGSASAPDSCRSRNWRRSTGSSVPGRASLWFESPINPTLRCVDIAVVAAACRAQRRDVHPGQHVRQSGESAAAHARRRSGHALGDEVPERPQRRHGRRARRIARDHRSAAAGPQALRRRARADVGLRPGARHEDAGRARGAAQRERHAGGAVAAIGDRPRGAGVLSRACRRIPITRLPGSR